MRPLFSTVTMYGGLLAGGLALAYWASLPAPEGEEEKVNIASFEPRSVTEITLKTKDTDVSAARREGDQRYWIAFKKTEKAPEPPAPPVKEGETPPPPPPAPEPKVISERFLSNDKLAELTQSFHPLAAQRIIGKIEEAQLDEFGLKDKSDVFTLKTSDGKNLKLYLGKKSYGSRNRFVMEESGRVMLVDDTGIDNFEKANLRLYDRRLVSFELDDVTHAGIQAGGGKAKRFAHTLRDKNGELTWSDDEENAAPKPSYGTWMDKIAKLRLASYADEVEAQSVAGIEPFLKVSLEKGGKVLDTLSFIKQAGQGGAPATYWATSDFLKTPAKLVLSRVEPIEKDIDAVLSGAAPGG